MRKLIAAALVALAALALPALAQDAKKSPAAAEKKAEAQMDINTATAAQLATLPGIGDARAKAIVKGRPYKGKNELVDKKIIPESVYNGIKDKIIAKQGEAAKPAEPAKKDEKKK